MFFGVWHKIYYTFSFSLRSVSANDAPISIYRRAHLSNNKAFCFVLCPHTEKNRFFIPRLVRCWPFTRSVLVLVYAHVRRRVLVFSIDTRTSVPSIKFKVQNYRLYQCAFSNSIHISVPAIIRFLLTFTFEKKKTSINRERHKHFFRLFVLDYVVKPNHFRES